MIPRTRLALPVVVLAGALALTGCASRTAGGSTPSASSSSSPSSSVRASAPVSTTSPEALVAPTRTSAGAGQAADLTITRGGSPAIPGPHWNVVKPSTTADSITITYAGAISPACGAVTEAVVTETSTTVVIALGKHARNTRQMCPLVIALRTAVIPLQAPLGDRTLLEPAAGVAAGPATTP